MYSLFNLRASIDFYFLLYLNEAEKHCGKSVALGARHKHTKKKKTKHGTPGRLLSPMPAVQKALFFQTVLSDLKYTIFYPKRLPSHKWLPLPHAQPLSLFVSVSLRVSEEPCRGHDRPTLADDATCSMGRGQGSVPPKCSGCVPPTVQFPWGLFNHHTPKMISLESVMIQYIQQCLQQPTGMNCMKPVV